MRKFVVGLFLALVTSCGVPLGGEVTSPQSSPLLTTPPAGFCVNKPVVPMALVGGSEVPITSSTSTWSKTGFSTSTFHPVPANFRTSNVTGAGAFYRDDDLTGGFAVGCSTNFRALTYTGGSSGNSAPIIGGISGCQTYLSTVGGICVWDDMSITAMPDGAFQVYTGASPNRWIVRSTGVQSPGGWTVTLVDYIR